MKVLEDKVVAAPDAREWRGRFPYNEIISLLDVNRPFNLAESTSQDLTVGDVLDLAGLETLRGLKLGYGRSAGSAELREEIAKACQVPAEHIVTTQGTALGLFLLAFETCRPGDEAVLVTPCFPPSRDCLLGAGVTVREVRLTFEDDYRLDLDALAASLSAEDQAGEPRFAAEPQWRAHAARHRREDPRAAGGPRAAGHPLHRRDLSRGHLRQRGRARQLRRAAPAHRHGRLGVQGAGRAGPAHGLAHRGGRRPQVAPGRRQDEHRDLRLGARRGAGHRAAAQPRERAGAAPPPARRRPRGTGGLVRSRAPAHRMDTARTVAPCAACACAPTASTTAAVARFWGLLPRHELQLASGAWFGESERVFRLGFGYLPPGRLGPALAALSAVLDSAEA